MESKTAIRIPSYCHRMVIPQEVNYLLFCSSCSNILLLSIKDPDFDFQTFFIMLERTFSHLTFGSCHSRDISIISKNTGTERPFFSPQIRKTH